ncbi:hypothetical protein CKK33_17990 [Mucilaginibacter sp. MD40]|uniref:hypothetical protein n=1 Tax=Mucilaginibacter sp. MD40 TaxID=2029590 RepID=UPI000BAC505C|nr:hypothetical protein [Mucilaginibacter sp. MD40]PAW95288.1 hypothetical protein CKK33_17990 [Mucilaginibacter sp. MD40]
MKKRLLLLTALLLNITLLFFNQKATGQVVFNSLQGNSPVYTKGVTNAVVYGFSVTVPAGAYFNGGPLRIGVTQSLNGFTSSANLVRTTSADPTLALSAPQGTYGANVNGSGDNGIAINGWPIIDNRFSFFLLPIIFTWLSVTIPALIHLNLPLIIFTYLQQLILPKMVTQEV